MSDGITYDYVANYAITVSSASGLTANDYKLANGKLEIIGTNTTFGGRKNYAVLDRNGHERRK